MRLSKQRLAASPSKVTKTERKASDRRQLTLQTFASNNNKLPESTQLPHVPTSFSKFTRDGILSVPWHFLNRASIYAVRTETVDIAGIAAALCIRLPGGAVHKAM